MGFCRDCKHWDYPGDGLPEGVPFGSCVLFEQAMSLKAEIWCFRTSGEYADATLATSPDFGCVEFMEKEEV